MPGGCEEGSPAVYHLLQNATASGRLFEVPVGFWQASFVRAGAQYEMLHEFACHFCRGHANLCIISVVVYTLPIEHHSNIFNPANLRGKHKPISSCNGIDKWRTALHMQFLFWIVCFYGCVCGYVDMSSFLLSVSGLAICNYSKANTSMNRQRSWDIWVLLSSSSHLAWPLDFEKVNVLHFCTLTR